MEGFASSLATRLSKVADAVGNFDKMADEDEYIHSDSLNVRSGVTVQDIENVVKSQHGTKRQDFPIVKTVLESKNKEKEELAVDKGVGQHARGLLPIVASIVNDSENSHSQSSKVGDVDTFHFRDIVQSKRYLSDSDSFSDSDNDESCTFDELLQMAEDAKRSTKISAHESSVETSDSLNDHETLDAESKRMNFFAGMKHLQAQIKTNWKKIGSGDKENLPETLSDIQKSKDEMDITTVSANSLLKEETDALLKMTAASKENRFLSSIFSFLIEIFRNKRFLFILFTIILIYFLYHKMFELAEEFVR